MKQFFKDYKSLCGESAKFYKKHWKGSLVFSTLVGLVAFAMFGGIEKLKDEAEIRRCSKMMQ